MVVRRPAISLYTVKIVNRAQKSEWKVCKLRTTKEFEHVSELKDFVCETFQDSVENPLSTIGYIEPGHRMRGKQQWLSSDEDLKDMYEVFAGKNEIMLWCYFSQQSSSAVSGKRTRVHSEEQTSSNPPPSKVPRTTNHHHHQAKMDELDDIIYYSLTEKHEKMYSPEQLRAWAHLLQMNKHDSYDEPPNKPFFRNRKSHRGDDGKLLGQSQSPHMFVSVSPGKRVNMQGQLIEQISDFKTA